MLKFLSAAAAIAAVTALAPLTHADAQVTSFTLDRTLSDSRIAHSSGLARSTYTRPLMWTHNDAGDGARIFGVNDLGRTAAVLTLKGATNVDFEDISTGPNHTLWAGDIGDDAARRATVQLYKITEPSKVRSATLTSTRYNLRFADGSRNAEAVLVHPVTGRVYVVTRNATGGAVYAAPETLSTTSTNTLTRVSGAPANITSGSFNPDGSRIVLSSYAEVFVYTAFGTTPVVVGKPALDVGKSVEVSVDGTRIMVGTEGSNSPVYSLAMPAVAVPTVPTTTPTAPSTPTAPTTPTTSTPVPAGLPGLGVYNGASGEKPDEKAITDFGRAPDVANSYYVPKQPQLNQAYETARIKRGTSPNITMSTKGTQYIAGIAKGDAAALKWLDTYIASLKKLAEVNPQVPVYATLEHEFRAKVKQGIITGASADPATYGKALSVFYAKTAAASANIKASYWMVGYDRAFEGAVGNAFTTLPQAVLFDPYANVAKDTIASITQGDLAWIKSQPWFRGQAIGLAEFGMPVGLGDAALAKFYTGVRGQLDTLGLKFAVFFNRSRDNDHQISHRGDGRTFPLAVSAFTSSLR